MGDWFDDLMDTPGFAAAYAEAGTQYARRITALCHFGNCVVDIDPLNGEVFGGMGPVMCPCDHLPGWKSKRIEGTPRPAFAVKARGRHGSRVQRSRRRHRLPDWSDFGEWLPARPR